MITLKMGIKTRNILKIIKEIRYNALIDKKIMMVSVLLTEKNIKRLSLIYFIYKTI